MAVVVWLLLTLPFHEDWAVLLISRGGFELSVSGCILAVRMTCSFQEGSVEGHILFLFPLVPLWDQLPFHFCCIGFLKGCQLDIGKWGVSVL